MSEKLLKGKVAVVTGSGQGIGRAIALALAREGAAVVTNNRMPGSTGHAILDEGLLNSLDEKKRQWISEQVAKKTGDAETTAGEIKSMGGEAVSFFGDVSNFETAGELIQTAVDAFGKLDILVNVAGTFNFGSILDMTEEAWDYVTLNKPKSYFNCMRHAAPLMVKQRWGRIINCTSEAWVRGILRHCNYAAANAGVVGLTRNAAMELYPYGVTCNAFTPFARTRASYELEAYEMAVGAENSPFMTEKKLSFDQHPGEEYVPPFLIYLASDLAADVSGTVFYVGGKKIGIYSEPVLKASLIKCGEGPWTLDELKKQVPAGLLGDYKSPAANGNKNEIPPV